MGNCCQGEEEVDESQLTSENAFYDPEGNCYFWDDVQQTGFTKLNTSEHFTRDENDLKLFYNDEDQTICLNIGGEEESYYVPNKKEVEPEIDTDATDSTQKEEPDDGIDGAGYDDGDGGIERETPKKFIKTKRSKKPKSNQRYKSKKISCINREKQPPSMGRTRGRGRLFRKVKKTPPIRSGLQCDAKSPKSGPRKRRNRTLKKQGVRRL